MSKQVKRKSGLLHSPSFLRYYHRPKLELKLQKKLANSSAMSGGVATKTPVGVLLKRFPELNVSHGLPLVPGTPGSARTGYLSTSSHASLSTTAVDR
jgi:hypothetical protein